MKNKIFLQLVDRKIKLADKPKGGDEKVLEEKAEAKSLPPSIEQFSFNFKEIPDLADCYPIEFCFCGQTVKDIVNWQNFYYQIFKLLYKVYYRELILCELLVFSKKQLLYSISKDVLSEPQEISDNFFIETDISTDKIIQIVKKLLEIRNIDPEKIIVTCKRQVADNRADSEQELSASDLCVKDVLPENNADENISSDSVISEIINYSLPQIIGKLYSNGFSLNEVNLPELFQKLVNSIKAIDCDKYLDNLRGRLFERSDGRYFLPSNIADSNAIALIKNELGKFLDPSFKLDVDSFYKYISDKCQLSGLRDKDDFADFIKFICSSDTPAYAVTEPEDMLEPVNTIADAPNSAEADNPDAIEADNAENTKAVKADNAEAEDPFDVQQEAKVSSIMEEQGNAMQEEAGDSNDEASSRWIRFEGVNAADFVKTVPCYCYLDGEDVKDQTWAKVLVKIVEHEIARNNRALDKLQEAPLIGTSSRPFFMKENIAHLTCRQCSNGFWISVNYDLPGLLRVIEAFCRRCGYRKDQLDLYGMKKQEMPLSQGDTEMVVANVHDSVGVYSSSVSQDNAHKDIVNASAGDDNSADAIDSNAADSEADEEFTVKSNNASNPAQKMSEQEKAYFDYLRDNTDLAEVSCKKYVGVIRSAERYAKEHGYKSCKLFTDNQEQIIATVNELYADSFFINYNKEQHNRFTASINKLLEMIGAAVPAVDLTNYSVDTISSGFVTAHEGEQYSSADEYAIISADTYPNWIKFTFDNVEDFAFTKPVKCLLAGINMLGKNWRYVLINIVEHEIQRQNPALEILKTTSLLRSDRPFLLKEKLEDCQCKQLSNGYWIVLYLGIPSIMRFIRAFCLHCGYTEDQICMYGVKKSYAPNYAEDAVNMSLEEEQEPGKSVGLSQQVASETNEAVVAVMQAHFQNGFRQESIIDLQRFRMFANEMGLSIPEEDELLQNAIRQSGVLIDNKIYCMSDVFAQELTNIVDGIFSAGAQVIYYYFLLERNSEWMYSHNIFSEEMLKKFLQEYIPGFYYSKRFMALDKRNEIEAVTDEIKRVWREQQTESVEELDGLLPYVPPENIRRVITGNNLFANVSTSTYLFIDRFNISEEDKQKVLELTEKQYSENGFVRLSDLALESIEEDNYELPSQVIGEAVFKKLLSDRFVMNKGQGLLFKADAKQEVEQDVLDMLKQYLSSKEECTISEACEEAKRLTGKDSSDYALQALYDSMVRIDKNTFVADRFVSFNSSAIDSVLSDLVKDHFLGLREITTFALFPFCGYSWNDYLLASFCYRYSHKYCLYVRSFTKNNAGIIAERDFDKTYDEMLSMAVLRSGIELTPEAIRPYLGNGGYIARADSVKLAEICQQAQKLRE